jgi:endonuclease/exonuclease/phosphatase family metal-dependent hydrolase
MKLATYNVENLYERPRVMNLDTWADGKECLEDYTKLNTLIQKEKYTQSVKGDLIAIMKKYPGLLTKGTSKFITLRENHGKLLRKPKNGPVEIAVDGRNDWLGWFDLETESVKETTVENTARVIGLMEADVQCLVEVENRPGLKRFNDQIISKINNFAYDHAMLIDGNDERGIDVGIMSKQGYEVISMISHVDDKDGTGLIFSRDCAEYYIRTSQNNILLILLNHLKSKGFGSATESAKKRLRQASRIREIYDQRIQDGYKHIAVVGDFNDFPTSDALKPLTGQGSPLVDIGDHQNFTNDGRKGTFKNGTNSEKIDYILMSPLLSKTVKGGAIERRGVWGGKNGTLFPHLDTMKSSSDAASDHAGLWAELDI